MSKLTNLAASSILKGPTARPNVPTKLRYRIYEVLGRAVTIVSPCVPASVIVRYEQIITMSAPCPTARMCSGLDAEPCISHMPRLGFHCAGDYRTWWHQVKSWPAHSRLKAAICPVLPLPAGAINDPSPHNPYNPAECLREPGPTICKMQCLCMLFTQAQLFPRRCEAGVTRRHSSK